MIDKNKKKLKISNYVFTDEEILIIPNEFWRVIKLNEIQAILDFIISKLEELKVEPFIPKDIID